jgi:hypothetical protein
MVYGINKFIEYFKDYKEYYVLIGGTACDIIMQEEEIEFRATKDLDIVLIVEMLDESFGNIFWKFIEKGGYQNRSRTSGKQQFYRFEKPTDEEYPQMIELFSRNAFSLENPKNSNVLPIHINDNVKSLSAILLNDDYYKLLLKGKKENDKLSYLSGEILILFKIKAYLDLKERKENGEKIDSRDIKKHKNDIFRILAIIAPDSEVKLEGCIKSDVIYFLNVIESDKPDLKNLGLRNISYADAIEIINELFL